MRKFYKVAWNHSDPYFRCLIDFFSAERMSVTELPPHYSDRDFIVRLPYHNYCINLNPVDLVRENYEFEYRGDLETDYGKFLKCFNGQIISAAQVATIISAIILHNHGVDYIPIKEAHIRAVKSAWTMLPGTDYEVPILSQLYFEKQESDHYNVLAHNGLEWVRI